MEHETSKVKQLRQNVRTVYLRNAKKVLKTRRVKNVVGDMRQHFKNSGWPLDYNIHRELSGLPSTQFNAVLEVLKLKITYSKEHLTFLIKK